ncbi:MAG: acyltransferase [Methanopyri archaeon]|nr:acyltransferase [Methanopyri archaeon]
MQSGSIVSKDADVFIHPTAVVAEGASIGPGTRVWHFAQVREGAVIGRECVLSKGVYIDKDVRVGDRVKVQNGVSVYQGVTLEDEVFVGPHAVFTNDRYPRSISPVWEVTPTLVRLGASIGANVTIVCGITIGRFAMVGAGSVVTHDVPDHALVVGNPARVCGIVCSCGHPLKGTGRAPRRCSECGREVATHSSDPGEDLG